MMETHAVLCSQGLTAAPALLTHPDDVIVTDGTFGIRKACGPRRLGFRCPCCRRRPGTASTRQRCIYPYR